MKHFFDQYKISHLPSIIEISVDIPTLKLLGIRLVLKLLLAYCNEVSRTAR